MADAGESVAAACCGLCCLCGFSGLSTWCNGEALGGRGGGRECCGSCCNKSLNDDSMERWEKDAAKLRTEKQPAPAQPMTIPSTGQVVPPETK